MLRAVGPRNARRVLDFGSGFGGCSRYVAGQLLLSAHEMYLSKMRFIGIRHTSALMKAVTYHGDASHVEKLVVDAPRLQLAFKKPRPLLKALWKLARLGESEALSRAHAKLPHIFLDRFLAIESYDEFCFFMGQAAG